MLAAYVPNGHSLERRDIVSGEEVPDNAVWLDLVNPAPGEDKLIERLLGIAVPTREEMQEIEVSSRLYVENHARYMTATLMCNSDTATPKTTAVTFILSGHRLVTVRYDDPRPFMIVGNKLAPELSGQRDRRNRADRSARRRDRPRRRHSRAHRPRGRPGLARHFRARQRGLRPGAVLQGHPQGDRQQGRPDIEGAREPGLDRADSYCSLPTRPKGMRWHKDVRLQLQANQRDVLSLSDHATYLSNKITFLLDAMLGVVTIEQNNIIKIFSIAAVALMPPTLIASIYGMNFKHMPELEWTYGYPFAIVLMLAAAILPFVIFKWKKWL
jgi:magnesium transporter